MANVDITLGQLKQIAATINVYGEANQMPEVSLGTTASEKLIQKLAECPGATVNKFATVVANKPCALEVVTLEVDGVRFRAQRQLPLRIVDGDAA